MQFSEEKFVLVWQVEAKRVNERGRDDVLVPGSFLT